MAEAERLRPFQYLTMLGMFSERFGQHPDEVFVKTSFDTIANFSVSWSKKEEFDSRYFEADQLMNDNTSGT